MSELTLWLGLGSNVYLKLKAKTLTGRNQILLRAENLTDCY